MEPDAAGFELIPADGDLRRARVGLRRVVRGEDQTDLPRELLIGSPGSAYSESRRRQGTYGSRGRLP